MSDKIIHFFTPEEQAERMRGPKHVNHYTEEDWYIDNYYRGVAQTRRMSEEALEAQARSQLEDQVRKKIQAEAMEAEHSFVNEYHLQRPMEEYTDKNPRTFFPLLDFYPENASDLVQEAVAQHFGEKSQPVRPPKNKKPSSRQQIEAAKKAEEKQMAELKEYIKGVVQNTGQPNIEWFRPSIGTQMFKHCVEFIDQIPVINSKMWHIKDQNEVKSLSRQQTYVKQMAQSWYQMARGYEKALFHTFTLLQATDTTNSFNPEDFAELEKWRKVAESKLYEVLRIHWQTLFPWINASIFNFVFFFVF